MAQRRTSIKDILIDLLTEAREIRTYLKWIAEGYFTEEEVAAILKVSKHTIKKARDNGEIGYVPIGGGDGRFGHIRYSMSDVLEYAARMANRIGTPRRPRPQEPATQRRGACYNDDPRDIL